MNTPIEALIQLDVDTLDRIQQAHQAAGNQAGVAAVDKAIAHKAAAGTIQQTQKLSDSGKLIKVSHTDPETGRLTHRFVGDPAEWMRAYEGDQFFSGRVNSELFSGANSGAAIQARTEQARLVQLGRAADAQQQAPAPQAERPARPLSNIFKRSAA